MRARKSIHPLLLETSYWRNRLKSLNLEQAGLLLHERSDLSGRGRIVVEFHLRTPEGARIWGLIARPAWTSGPRPACIRSVGPTDLPTLDPEAVEKGLTEVVYQEPAGRRLEDRVLDALRIRRIAAGSADVDGEQVAFQVPPDQRSCDAVLIAERLLDSRFS